MALRIAIDGRTLTDHYPGIGRYVWNLVNALARVGDDARILLLVDPQADNQRFTFENLDPARVRVVEAPWTLKSLRQQVALPRLLRDLRADVFHAPYYLTAYRPPCPLAVTIYDVIGILDPAYLPSTLSRQTYRVALQQSLHAAAGVFTLSKVAKDDLISHFEVDPKSVLVTPAAADAGLHPLAGENLEAERERLKLPSRYVLYVGTNKPHKNLSRLMEAWAEASPQAKSKPGETDWRLLIAGRQDKRYPDAQQKVRELGLKDVRFLGEVAEQDLPALYSAAKVLVQPSLVEGFGLPVLEAMACGTPVACSRTSSLPAVAGAAAAYFDPADTRSITTALVRLLNNGGYRQMLAERGAQRAAQFSWDKTARTTLMSYRRLATSNGGG